MLMGFFANKTLDSKTNYYFNAAAVFSHLFPRRLNYQGTEQSLFPRFFSLPPFFPRELLSPKLRSAPPPSSASISTRERQPAVGTSSTAVCDLPLKMQPHYRPQPPRPPYAYFGWGPHYYGQQQNWWPPSLLPPPLPPPPPPPPAMEYSSSIASASASATISSNPSIVVPSPQLQQQKQKETS